ncbi:MAG: phospho-N-acetylmuramoyl-pentapeptide-transferase [Clostridia bacterium]|nr:phospho-N-acetylmuramoyl-pentapeptide-transferase [Clostridia bacterium]
MNTWLALAIGAVASFLVAFLLGYVVIPWLHKLKFGQTILDIGPSWHKNKQGTPTMGGILFMAGFLVSMVVVLVADKLMGGDIVAGDSLVPGSVKTKLYSGIIMAFAFALIGFVDDYIKVAKKRNLGLTILQKTVAQILVMGGYLASLYSAGATYMWIPFYGNLDLGWFFWILGIAVLYCTVNAVNFTDGIDGLCASVTATFAVAALVISVLRGVFGVSLLSAALFGGLAGYLIWNWHPAKVMMGDTGSMFLGGLVVAVSYCLDMPWLILLIGCVYVMEFASDVIQIGYFKLTHGKRIFKMAPIHHHFEKCGWKEKKIVYVFSLINIIGSVAAILLVYFGQPK